ncbi:MAG: T9SS type A sorting domain-containing protein [Bacteroidota bacterium]
MTDSFGCKGVSTANITEPAEVLTVSASQTHSALCRGGDDGTVTANVSGGTPTYSYLWNSVPAQTTQTATGLTSGTYTVTITDAHSCTATASAAVTEPSAALAAWVSSHTDVLCHGESTGHLTVGVSGGTSGYSYLWNTTPPQTTNNAGGLTAGSYTVTVTDAHSCTIAITDVITEPSEILVANLVSQTNVQCHSGNNGSATAFGSGGTSAYAYQWSDGQTTMSATGLTSGTYIVTVTDSHACTATTSTVITQPDASLTADAVQTHSVLCHGNNDGIATVSVSGGTSGYSYLWSTSPPQTTIAATGLTAGNYSVTVTDAHTCTVIATTTITQPSAALFAAVTSHTDILCHGESNGSLTVVVSGGTTGYTYLWNTTPPQTSSVASGLTAGSYTLTVTDAHSCTVTVTDVITEPSAALAVVISGQTNVQCHNGNNGTITVSVSGGTLNYSYMWSNSQTTATAGSLTAGTYTVTVTDAHSCWVTTSTVVTQPAESLTADAVQTHSVLCHGNNDGIATVTASGGTTGYSYLWNTSPAQTTNVATGLTAGSYSVTVTDSHSCTVVAATSITQPSAVLYAAVTSHTDILCHGESNGSLTAGVSGGTTGYTYLWNTTPPQTTNVASGLTAGSYTLTVTDAHSCSVIVTDVITEPSAVLAAIISAQTNVLCHGGYNGAATAGVSGGTLNYSYLWSNSQTTATATSLTAGTYTVTVTDAHLCSATTFATITEPDALSIGGTVTNVSCYLYSNGAIAATYSGGVLPYSYLWSNAQTTAGISGIAAGNYSVTVTDAHSCLLSQSWVVTQPAAWSVDITGPDATCCNANAAPDHYCANVSGSFTTPVTYQWVVVGGTLNSGANTSCIDVTWSCCGQGYVTVLVTKPGGCTVTMTKTISVSPAPVPVITGPVQVTSGQTGTQYCTPSVPGDLYTWAVMGGSVVSGQGTSCITIDWGPYPVCGCGSVTVSESNSTCTVTAVYPVTLIPGSNVKISGYVSYQNASSTRMNGVTIQLKNSANVVVGTIVTACNPTGNQQTGYYAFTDLPNDTYNISGSYNGTWGGNNATDALIVQLNILGTYPLAGLREVVADVNATNTITALDALYIKLRTVGSISSYPAGDWKVTDTTVTLSGPPLAVDLKVLCVGDVNGSYLPLLFKETNSLSVIEDGVVNVPVGEPFIYNIRSSKPADLGAMTLFMDYDKERFEIMDIASQWEGMKYTLGDGKIAVAWADTKAMKVKDNDLVLSLNMRVKSKIAEPSRVFYIKAGSEFADIFAKPYDDYDLKMANLITDDGAQALAMFNYPNPFTNTTTIIYSLPEAGHVKLVLTDLFGKTISTLVDKQDKAGRYTLTVDPSEFNMSAGVYLYKIIFDSSTDTSVKVNKMVFTR